jgi:hypothetical protein
MRLIVFFFIFIFSTTLQAQLTNGDFSTDFNTDPNNDPTANWVSETNTNPLRRWNVVAGKAVSASNSGSADRDLYQTVSGLDPITNYTITYTYTITDNEDIGAGNGSAKLALSVKADSYAATNGNGIAPGAIASKIVGNTITNPDETETGTTTLTFDTTATGTVTISFTKTVNGVDYAEVSNISVVKTSTLSTPVFTKENIFISTVAVYNLLGQKINKIEDGQIYIVKYRSSKGTETKKIIFY